MTQRTERRASDREAGGGLPRGARMATSRLRPLRQITPPPRGHRGRLLVNEIGLPYVFVRRSGAVPASEPPSGLVVREFMPTDSLAELTELLHRAYARLAQRGLRYVATYQDEDTTARRIAGGTCLVATLGNCLVGTITFKPRLATSACEWYQRPGVACFGQFAVSPDHQGFGIGSLLMDLVEERAWTTGAQELALDTSDQAEDLIVWYHRRGYRLVGDVDWEVTNYRSVVLSKHLALPAVTFRKLSGRDGDLLPSSWSRA